MTSALIKIVNELPIQNFIQKFVKEEDQCLTITINLFITYQGLRCLQLGMEKLYIKKRKEIELA
jgi:hypothetical protein